MHKFISTAGRTSADIVNWLKKKTGPPAVSLDSVDKASKMIEKDDVVVIGFFKVGLGASLVKEVLNSMSNKSVLTAQIHPLFLRFFYLNHIFRQHGSSMINSV